MAADQAERRRGPRSDAPGSADAGPLGRAPTMPPKLDGFSICGVTLVLLPTGERRGDSTMPGLPQASLAHAGVDADRGETPSRLEQVIQDVSLRPSPCCEAGAGRGAWGEEESDSCSQSRRHDPRTPRLGLIRAPAASLPLTCDGNVSGLTLTHERGLGRVRAQVTFSAGQSHIRLTSTTTQVCGAGGRLAGLGNG